MKTHFSTRIGWLTAFLIPGFGLFGAQDPEYLNDSLPQQWTYSRQYDQTLPTEDQWWRTFNDPLLDSLINYGENVNYDVLMAAKRIDIAHRTLQQTISGYFPEITASAGYQKERHVKGTFALGLQMNWEIDLFGRIKKSSDQARAAWKASRVEYAGTMVSLAADIATTYFDLCMSRQLLDVLRRHVSSQEEIVHITEVRYETGLSSLLDVTQARTVLYTTRAELPRMEAQIENDINALATLLSLYPDQMRELLSDADTLPPCPTNVTVGIPADILRRRPDIVEAEFQLAQCAAAIGIAKKEFLPILQLSGSIGTSSNKADRLFGDNTINYSIAPTLSWTIFDGLARNYKTAAAKEQMLIAIDQYNLTVLTAFQEISNAMAQYSAFTSEIGMLQSATDESIKSLDLSLDLYKKGLSTFSNVISALRAYLNNQSALVSSQGDALTSLVQLYQALGGGWDMDQIYNK